MIEIGLDVTSVGSVDTRLSVSPERLRIDGLVGSMEYERGPQKLTPSEFPFVKLAESVARTVCVAAAKFTYASMSLTGSKVSNVLSHRSLTSMKKLNVLVING